MAAIDFPASPTVNQLFTAPNGVTYKWTGTIWISVATVPAVALANPTYDIFTATAALNTQLSADPLLNGVFASTSGNQIFSRSFTALNAAHRVRIRVRGTVSTLVASNGLLGIFVDGGNAVRSAGIVTQVASQVLHVLLDHEAVLAAGARVISARCGFFGAGFLPNSFGNASAGFANNTGGWTMSIEELNS